MLDFYVQVDCFWSKRDYFIALEQEPFPRLTVGLLKNTLVFVCWLQISVISRVEWISLEWAGVNGGGYWPHCQP